MNVNVETGDLVKWCFSSLDKDIDFQVAFVTKDGVAQTVFPLSRVQSKASLVTGGWKEEANGDARRMDRSACASTIPRAAGTRAV